MLENIIYNIARENKIMPIVIDISSAIFSLFTRYYYDFILNSF